MSQPTFPKKTRRKKGENAPCWRWGGGNEAINGQGKREGTGFPRGFKPMGANEIKRKKRSLAEKGRG